MKGEALEGLPERLSLAYEAEACLSSREGRSVWRMRRRADGEPFLLKLSLEGTEDLSEEFHLLKRLARRLPGAVPFPVDYFRDEGTDYLLRSYLPGETLEQYRQRSGGCGAELCTEIGQKLCALLGTLHTLEPPIIHRDIKPENVILRGKDAVLIDFDAARLHKPGAQADTQVLGTTGFAAPEQYGLSQSDVRTDIYSLGVLINVMLTGEHPSKKLAEGHMGRVVQRCTQVNPQKRYKDVLHLMEVV